MVKGRLVGLFRKFLCLAVELIWVLKGGWEFLKGEVGVGVEGGGDVASKVGRWEMERFLLGMKRGSDKL